MEHIEAHTMRLLETVPAGQMKSSAVHFQPGDVLYGRLRPYLNKVYLPAFEGLCSSEFIVFPDSAELDSRYVKYFLNCADFVRFASRLNTGDRPRIDFDQIAEFPVPLPPLAEQRRLVAAIEEHLSRLDAAVAALKRTRSLIPQYRAAVLKAAIDGRLLPQASRWGRSTVGALAEKVDYGTSARAALNGEVPILRMGNILVGKLDLKSLKYLPASHPEFPKLLLNPGDLLFNRTNSAELVGKTAVYSGTPHPCSFASYLIRVRVSDRCNPGFLSVFLNSVYGRKWIAGVVSQQVGQANVSGSKLKALAIPLPGRSEQDRIVEEVERRFPLVEAIREEVDASLARSTRLRQSILKRAFEGKLVPQDPKDEPASVLLERIRASRVATTGEKSKRARQRA